MANTDDLSSTSQPGWRDAVDNPWMLLGLLFFVLAIFGLPLLWMSRAFSTSTKVLLSLVVTIYTLALLGCTGAVVWWAWTVVQSSL
jgi:hypothetical protein